jgi:hypothetical protein
MLEAFDWPALDQRSGLLIEIFETFHWLTENKKTNEIFLIRNQIIHCLILVWF